MKRKRPARDVVLAGGLALTAAFVGSLVLLADGREAHPTQQVQVPSRSVQTVPGVLPRTSLNGP